jgi:hypothetical protein
VERDLGARDIGERDIRERDMRDMDIGETVARCRFNQQLLIHIHIPGASGCLSFLKSSNRWARFLWRHTPLMLQPTDGISLQSLRSWARVRGF